MIWRWMLLVGIVGLAAIVALVLYVPWGSDDHVHGCTRCAWNRDRHDQ